MLLRRACVQLQRRPCERIVQAGEVEGGGHLRGKAATRRSRVGRASVTRRPRGGHTSVARRGTERGGHLVRRASSLRREIGLGPALWRRPWRLLGGERLVVDCGGGEASPLEVGRLVDGRARKEDVGSGGEGRNARLLHEHVRLRPSLRRPRRRVELGRERLVVRRGRRAHLRGGKCRRRCQAQVSGRVAGLSLCSRAAASTAAARWGR